MPIVVTESRPRRTGLLSRLLEHFLKSAPMPLARKAGGILYCPAAYSTGNRRDADGDKTE